MFGIVHIYIRDTVNMWKNVQIHTKTMYGGQVTMHITLNTTPIVKHGGGSTILWESFAINYARKSWEAAKNLTLKWRYSFQQDNTLNKQRHIEMHARLFRLFYLSKGKNLKLKPIIHFLPLHIYPLLPICLWGNVLCPLQLSRVISSSHLNNCQSGVQTQTVYLAFSCATLSKASESLRKC